MRERRAILASRLRTSYIFSNSSSWHDAVRLYERFNVNVENAERPPPRVYLRLHRSSRWSRSRAFRRVPKHLKSELSCCASEARP